MSSLLRACKWCQVVASPTGSMLVITDPLAVSGPESCGVFGAQPGYLTTGAVYVYTQQSGTQYMLAQALQGNTSSVSGFGADVGACPLSVHFQHRPHSAWQACNVDVHADEYGGHVRCTWRTGNCTSGSRPHCD